MMVGVIVVYALTLWRPTAKKPDQAENAEMWRVEKQKVKDWIHRDVRTILHKIEVVRVRAEDEARKLPTEVFDKLTPDIHERISLIGSRVCEQEEEANRITDDGDEWGMLDLNRAIDSGVRDMLEALQDRLTAELDANGLTTSGEGTFASWLTSFREHNVFIVGSCVMSPWSMYAREDFSRPRQVGVVARS